jgi:hypothetical protein
MKENMNKLINFSIILLIKLMLSEIFIIGKTDEKYLFFF